MDEYITTLGGSKPGAGLEGAILAGGASRRMGQDKLFLRFGAKTALERISEAMQPLVGRLRVVGRAASAEIPQAQADLYPGLGPLAGIHAALATAVEDRVLVVACDFPLVTTAFLRGLAGALSPEYEAVVPCPGGVPLAVCAVYRVSCAAEAGARLERRDLAARDFARSLDARYLDDQELRHFDPVGSCLLNVNTAQDFERVRAILGNESKT
ncbi:MAG TPA: molybdenum cofactor guanylyltransferase [Vicinamibacteria bacterium]|nr:molybdenum cofactor guanylyltransferase [Vicinamibacteria bacterium]